MNFMRDKPTYWGLGLGWWLAAGAGLQAAAENPLKEANLIEVIRDVWRIPDVPGRKESGPKEPAVKHSRLRAPDRLSTGRESRAELQAPDGTITRLGANTLFAFGDGAREFELEQGSVLFHSPTGRGGGKIRSPAASATVLGTTLIVAATPEGGFKVLVLEGRASVVAARTTRTLEAGQLTFVLPGGGGTGAPGPPLNFDLARQVKGSQLVNGFARPLASQAKIDQAIEGQRRAVGQGQFTTTGFLVFTATSDTQVNGIEAAGPDADDKLVGEFTTPQRIALNTGATLTSSRLPPERLFRTELLVPATESAFLNKESDVLIVGLLALDLTVATPTLSLAGWGLKDFQLVGKTAVTFTGSTRFTDLAGVDYLRVFSPQINVPVGATIVADFPAPGRASTFYFDAGSDFTLTGGTVSNPGGGLILQTHVGALRIKDETLRAGGLIGAPTVVPSAINVDAPFGALEVTGSTVQAAGGGFAALGNTVAISATRFELGGDFWSDATDTARFDTLTLTGMPAGAVFQATAGTQVTLRAVGLDGFREVNLGARTLVLESVAFAAGATVRLVSEQGRLAPQPNTNQAVQPGLVNFVRDVTYGGRPAQDYVAVAVGGTGLQPGNIIVSKPTP